MAGEIVSSGIASGFVDFVSAFGTFLFYSWPFLLLFIMFVNKMMWKRYPLEAIILEKKGENLVKTNDRVGKFFDGGADMTFYRLSKCKDTIPVYNYDWVLHNVYVPQTFLERYVNLLRGNSGTIFLFKYGSKQYKPINAIADNNAKKKFVRVDNEKGEPIYSYQYVQFDPRKVVGILDFEVIDWDNMNFMVQEQRASIVRRAKKGEYLKQILVPLAIIGASVLVSIFILKFSLDAGHSLRGGASQEAASGTALEESKVGGAISGFVAPGQ